MDDLVVAGGAVLWRRAGDGAEIAVIHRPGHDDWSLPKGKVDPGETVLEAAVREVREETGQRARPGEPLGSVRYRVRGRDKVVHYWVMEAQGGDFAPGEEVDELRWLPPADAVDLLTHAHDRELVARFGLPGSVGDDSTDGRAPRAPSAGWRGGGAD